MILVKTSLILLFTLSAAGAHFSKHNNPKERDYDHDFDACAASYYSWSVDNDPSGRTTQIDLEIGSAEDTDRRPQGLADGLFQLWVVVPAAFLDIFLAVVLPSSVFSTRRSMGKRENRRPTELCPTESLE